jgi:hypothetical protein
LFDLLLTLFYRALCHISVTFAFISQKLAARGFSLLLLNKGMWNEIEKDFKTA